MGSGGRRGGELLHLSAAPRSKRMKRASERSHCAVSLARPQFQTSLDHFSCSPEMNNAHINWLPVNKFPSRCAIFFLPPPLSSIKGLGCFVLFCKTAWEGNPAGSDPERPLFHQANTSLAKPSHKNDHSYLSSVHLFFSLSRHCTSKII